MATVVTRTFISRVSEDDDEENEGPSKDKQISTCPAA